MHIISWLLLPSTFSTISTRSLKDLLFYFVELVMKPDNTAGAFFSLPFGFQFNSMTPPCTDAGVIKAFVRNNYHHNDIFFIFFSPGNYRKYILDADNHLSSKGPV